MIDIDYLETLPLVYRIPLLVSEYKQEILEENDWFFKFNDFEVNIHDYDEDGIFQVVGYPIDSETEVADWSEATEVRLPTLDWRNEK